MTLSIRPIHPADDPAVARLIRTVMPEFGAVGPGFAINDPEVDAMAANYPAPGAYFVVVNEKDEVVGGGGFAQLIGGQPGTCELRKMYFLPAIRGHGMGQKLLSHCLERAKTAGFTRCYIETLTGMDAAMRLYQKNGFVESCAEGATGHSGCDRFYARQL